MWRLIVGLVVVLTLSLTAGFADASINELLVAVDGGNTVTRFDGDSGVFIDDFIGGYTENSMEGLAIGTMTIGPDGSIYLGVRDAGRRIIRFGGITGEYLGVFTELPDRFNDPDALTFGPDGNLYVAVGTIRDASGDVSNGGVFKIDGTSGELLGEFGETNQNISGLSSPEGMVFGPDGDLYIAGYSSHGILRFDGTTGQFKGVFGDASSEVIEPFYPRDVLFGPDGMYVANQGAASGNVLLFDGLSGDYLGEFIASGAGGLTNPMDIEFGPDNNLYVADYEATGITRFDGNTGLFLDVFTEDPGHPLNSRPLNIQFRLVIRGDMNQDGHVNGLDVDLFVQAVLSEPFNEYGDMNGDGVVTGLDVDPFVAAVVGGVQPIPEPSALLLALVALGVVGSWRKWKPDGRLSDSGFSRTGASCGGWRRRR